MKFVTKLLAPMACSAGLVLCGCQPAGTDGSTAAVNQTEGHDHEHEGHDHPKTLKEGIQALSDLYAKIKPAFESKDPDAAHDELHEVAHLLDEAFPGLIKQDSSLDSESKTKLESAVNTLFDAFSKLDGVLHGGPDVEFSEVDSSIAKAMEELKGLVP
jgi:hypothetical protein